MLTHWKTKILAQIISCYTIFTLQRALLIVFQAIVRESAHTKAERAVLVDGKVYLALGAKTLRIDIAIRVKADSSFCNRKAFFTLFAGVEVPSPFHTLFVQAVNAINQG